MVENHREEWLSDLGSRMGLSKLEFDKSGICQLFLNEDLIITIYRPEESEKLVIFGQLHTPPLSPEIMKAMLKDNRSSARFLAPVISLSPDEDAIEAHVVLDQADLEKGDDAIEVVVKAIEYWGTAPAGDFREEEGTPLSPNVDFV